MHKFWGFVVSNDGFLYRLAVIATMALVFQAALVAVPTVAQPSVDALDGVSDDEGWESMQT